MKKEGLIKSNAYSLWLNDLDANSGSILFGGVNTAKFHGNLASLPIQQINGMHARFTVTLTGLSMDVGSNPQPFDSPMLPTPVLLDSGSSLTYLPAEITNTIFEEVGVSYNSQHGVAYIPCNTPVDQNHGFNFTFSGPSIFVGMEEMIVNFPTGRRPTYPNGDPACIFGISPAGPGGAVLGDTFLRSAYVVFDLENNEISIAKTNFNATESNIVEIGTGKDSVPDATGVAHPVTTVIAPTGDSHLNPSGSGAVSNNVPVLLAGCVAVLGFLLGI